MLRYHMAVITSDKRLRREVRRVTTATNSTADFLDDTSTLSSDKPVHLVVFDARNQLPPKNLLQIIPAEAAVTYILPNDTVWAHDMFRELDLLRDTRVASIFCHDEQFDDDEFIASATKSLRHDIFGLHKYFPWGVTTFSMVIKNYEEKSEAIEIMMQYAQESGMRGPVRERIQLVCDELMMNALYHAPRDKDGHELYRNKPRKEMARIDEVLPVQVQYGCSGRYFGISVRDNCGSLSRDKILDYLVRVKEGASAQIENKSSGAGLGLISVLQSVSKLIFNLHPGSATEVIALFDTDLIGKGQIGARSLHMFTVNSDVDEDQDQSWKGDTSEPAKDQASAEVDKTIPYDRSVDTSYVGRWAMVVVLLAITTALGIAYYFTRGRGMTGASKPTIAIIADPADAQITLNGVSISSAQPIPLPKADAYKLVVEKPGHQPWSKTLSPAETNGAVRLYVNLSQDK